MFLGGTAAAAGAVAFPGPRASAAVVPAAPALTRAGRVFLERGLLLGAWVTAAATPTAAQWRASGLTTETFRATPGTVLPVADSWALASYPASRIGRRPAPGERLLDAAQHAHVARLFTIDFGDQDRYDPAAVDRLAAWFALARGQHPDVLVHNTQPPTGWSHGELRSYVRDAKPDLITFAARPFTGPDPYPGGGRPDIYDALNSYRLAALAGHDGTGRAPIAFGQLIGGFDTGYLPSESELNFGYFAGWTMGARWTNLVRWEHDTAGSLLNRGGPRSTRLARIAHESRRLSPFLVRLSSSDVRVIPGRHRDETGATTENARPATVAEWDGYASPYIAAIEADRNGPAGDVLIGYFQRLPGLTPSAAAAGLPAATAALFRAKQMKTFMLLNGGIAPNTAGASADGSGSATRQRITVTLNRLGQPNRLVRVDRTTGRLEPVALRPGPDETDRFTVGLDGGVADLFFLTTGPTYDQPPYTTVTTTVDAVAPGQTFTVHGTVANDTAGQPMPDVQARLVAPAGWSLQPDGSTPLGELHPGGSADTTWQVGVPAGAAPGPYDLSGETTYRYGPHTTVRAGARSTATVHIPYSALADGFSNTGIATDSDPGADFDGGGTGYSAPALAAAGITSGGTVESGGFSFAWPDVPAGSPDNVVCTGQAFSVGQSGRRLGFLGACTYGAGSGTGTVLYTDGSLQPFDLTIPDWVGADSGHSGDVVATVPCVGGRTDRGDGTVRLYRISVDLAEHKTVATVVLPRISDGVHIGMAAMHIFAMALG